MKNQPYKCIQINDNSFRIEENGVRSFLFTGTSKALLVDTGFGSGSIKEVVSTLTNLPIVLVNTHADGDHIGCNTEFACAYLHPSEFDRYYKEIDKTYPACPVWEGEKIDIGGRHFEVLLIPGHTPGSIALLDEENRILIAGDSVQAGSIYMFGPGRNLEAYIYSMEKLRDRLDCFDTIYPSHGPFPVEKTIIEELVQGAADLKNGKLSGQKAPSLQTAELYESGRVKFLYTAHT